MYDYIRDSYEYREERDRANRASRAADNYREDYLALRKMMREWFRQHNIVPRDEIRKAIGMK